LGRHGAVKITMQTNLTPRDWKKPLLALLLLATQLLADEKSEDRLKTIFNGTNLAGWEVTTANPYWRVENGVLIGENDEKRTGHVLFTKQTYTNFVLELEVRWSGEIDSGVMLRKPELQVQFGISRSLKRDMTGSFYTGGTAKYPEAGQGRGVDKLLKADHWNKVRLEARGSTFGVWLNGVQVSQYTDKKFAGPAPIGLQIHPQLKMKVEFRNIRVEELE
jgi:hypothetical protein